LTFILILYCHHDFSNYIAGWCFNIDSLGYILILLRFWITALVVCSRQKVLKENNYPSLFLLVNIFLLFFLIITFSANDYLLFYIRFESSLIPTLILILGWGYQPERLQAGVYILFYTLFASLPLLVSLIRLYNIRGRLTLGLVENVRGAGFISCI